MLVSIIHTTRTSPLLVGILSLYYTLPVPPVNRIEERSKTHIADLTVTGAPKPIVMNHATFAVIDNDRNLPTVSGRRNQNFSLWNFGEGGGLYFSSFPPFHVSLLPVL
jgi:hypothetical protein